MNYFMCNDMFSSFLFFVLSTTTKKYLFLHNYYMPRGSIDRIYLKEKIFFKKLLINKRKKNIFIEMEI